METLEKFLRNLLLGSLGLVASLASALPTPTPPLLNKISYQFSVEKWATTTSANVTISVDAALDKIGLDKINDYVLKNLQSMASSDDWHIVSYIRNQDRSGLEMMHIDAQARLPGSALANLRDKAKSISKPGETYTVTDINFSPSLVEMEQTHADARSAIYAQVKQEIARLNQVYPDQHYFLYALDFATSSAQPMPYVARTMITAMALAPEAARTPPSSIPVNAKIVETAAVVIASVTHVPATTSAS